MSDKKIRTTKEMITFLEQKIDLIVPQLEPLTSFILPGGSLLASILHLQEQFPEELKHMWLHYLKMNLLTKMLQFT